MVGCWLHFVHSAFVGSADGRVFTLRIFGSECLALLSTDHSRSKRRGRSVGCVHHAHQRWSHRAALKDRRRRPEGRLVRVVNGAHFLVGGSIIESHRALEGFIRLV